MPTEITPEQRDSLTPDADLILRITDAIMDHIHEGVSTAETAAAIRAEMVALGWRAPGPATEAEVERAARAGYAAEYPHHRWGLLPKGLKQGMREYARAALNAALNQEAGNG